MSSSATIQFFCSLENPRTLPDRPLTSIVDVQAYLPAEEPIVGGLSLYNSRRFRFDTDGVTFAYIVAKVVKATPGQIHLPLTLLELEYNLVGDVLDCQPIQFPSVPSAPENMLPLDHNPYMNVSGVVHDRSVERHEFSITVTQWTHADPEGTLPVIIQVPDSPKF
ncbi:hypothetical protein OF83DRAFT_1177622, partial [Amylostereum chailletii]